MCVYLISQPAAHTPAAQLIETLEARHQAAEEFPFYVNNGSSRRRYEPMCGAAGQRGVHGNGREAAAKHHQLSKSGAVHTESLRRFHSSPETHNSVTGLADESRLEQQRWWWWWWHGWTHQTRLEDEDEAHLNETRRQLPGTSTPVCFAKDDDIIVLYVLKVTKFLSPSSLDIKV